MSFRYEKDLVEAVLNSECFWKEIKAHDYKSQYKLEVDGLFGIPDLVVLQNKKNGRIRSLAFEMKLSNWKRALIQAYRYRAFAERTFVVLDHSKISPAKKHIEKFKKSKVGLISVDNAGNIVIHYFPNKEKPYSSPMHEKLEELQSEFQQVSLDELEYA